MSAAFSTAENLHKDVLWGILKKRIEKSNPITNSYKLMDSKFNEHGATETKNFELTNMLIDQIENRMVKREIEQKSEQYKHIADTQNILAAMQGKILSATNQTNLEIQKVFHALSQTLNESTTEILQSINRNRIEPTLRQLKTFVENIHNQINLLERTVYVDMLKQKLEDMNGILVHLEKHLSPTEPHYFYSLLINIIDQNLAVPLTVTDDTAYRAVEYLYSGTRLSYKLMQTVLNSYGTLAKIYHENDNILNIDKFNNYRAKYFNKFQEYHDSFGSASGSNGLIDKVIETLNKVLNIDFIKTLRKDIVEGVTLRLKRLNQIRKNGLKERTIFSNKIPPNSDIELDFSVSHITTPIGKWKDNRKIYYALQYVYKNGFTKIGKWSDKYTINGKANPELTLPTDEEVLKRFIFRKFNNKQPELVGIIEDKTQTKFRDINKDLYNLVLEQNMNTSLPEAEIYILNGADVNFRFRNGKSIFHIAAEKNRVQFGQLLLKHGANINAKDNKGQTPLHLAAEAGHKKFVEFAIENNADINEKSKEGLTAIMISALKKREDIFLYLLSNNRTDLNGLFFKNFTLLHIAIINSLSNLINKTIENGKIELNSKTIGDFTPLHLAIAMNNEKACLTLLKTPGVNVTAQTDEGLTPLHIASVVGNDKIMKTLTAYDGINFNAKAVGDLTPLHLAAAVGNLQSLKILSNQTNIDLNTETKDFMTPLHLAIALHHQEVALELLKQSTTQKHLKGKHGIMPVHLAVITGQNNILLKLLEKENVINEKVENNLTLLHFAAMFNNEEAVSILLQNGAGIHSVATGDLTTLHIACIYGSTEVVKLLINITDLINMKALNNLTALHFAASSNSKDIVKLLLHYIDIDSMDKDERTPLYIAYKYNNQELADTLISEGANLSLQLSNLKTFLHLAAESDDEFAVQNLLKQSHLINKKDLFGRTPLHYAVISRKVKVCSLLLSNRANAFVKDNEGNMPVHLAAIHGKSSSVGILIEHNSSLINVKGERNFSPLHFAVIMNQTEVTKLLIKKGANVTAVDIDGRTALHLAATKGSANCLNVLLKNGANVFAKDFHGQMPIHLAAQYGKTKAVIILQEKNTSQISAKGLSDKTPLHCAAEYNRLETVKVLINKRADVNAVDSTGRTALHWSAEKGYCNIVKTLLRSSADVFAKDNNNNTPICLAAENNKNHTADIIKDFTTHALLLAFTQELIKNGSYDDAAIDILSELNQGFNITHKLVNDSTVAVTHSLINKGSYEDVENFQLTTGTESDTCFETILGRLFEAIFENILESYQSIMEKLTIKEIPPMLQRTLNESKDNQSRNENAHNFGLIHNFISDVGEENRKNFNIIHRLVNALKLAVTYLINTGSYEDAANFPYYETYFETILGRFFANNYALMKKLNTLVREYSSVFHNTSIRLQKANELNQSRYENVHNFTPFFNFISEVRREQKKYFAVTKNILEELHDKMLSANNQTNLEILNAENLHIDFIRSILKKRIEISNSYKLMYSKFNELLDQKILSLLTC